MTIRPRLTLVASLPAMVVFLCLAGCASQGEPATSERDEEGSRVAIRSVLDAQVAAWNDGSIRDFMDGYARSDSLRFASGGNTWYGWDRTFERYQTSYADEGLMGRLAFSDLDVRLIGPDHAVVFGRWDLTRSESYGNVGGLFTLIFEHGSDGWRIVHDHTSARQTLDEANDTLNTQ